MMMKHKKNGLVFTTYLLILIVAFGCFLGSAFIAKNIAKPIYINDVFELDKIRENLKGYYVITNDLDLNDLYKNDNDGWIPIGTSEKPFEGKIDFNFHKLIHLRFSEEFLYSETFNGDSENILLGFVGYSKGVIIHCHIYDPIFPDLQNYGSEYKEIIFGSVCGINEGYVTSCQTTLFGSLPFKTSQTSKTIIGTIVGINRKQVLLCKVINSLFVQNNNECILGGVIGQSFDGSISKYLFKGSYIDIYNNILGGSLVCGGIIGEAFGCSYVDTCYFGSNYESSEQAGLVFRGLNAKTLITSGIIGIINEYSECTLVNCCVYNTVSFYHEAQLFYCSGFIGFSFSSNIKIFNSVFDSAITSSSIISVPQNLVANGKEVDSCSNSYCLSRSFFSIQIEKSDLITIDFSKITLKMLAWPTNTKNGYWIKTTDKFYLCIL